MASSSSPEARKFDVLGDDLDGTIVYRCICYGQEKLAKYKAMKRWLEEIGDEQMQTTLDRFHWTFEMSTWEKALQMADEVSPYSSNSFL